MRATRQRHRFGAVHYAGSVGLVVIGGLVGCDEGGRLATVEQRLDGGGAGGFTAERTGGGFGGSSHTGGASEAGGTRNGGGTASGGASSSTPPIARSSFVQLSELKIDPPSTDGNNEYIELRGTPSTSLDGYWLVIVEGDSDSNLGQIDKVIDFGASGATSCAVGANGLALLIAAAGAVVPADAVTATCVASALVRGGLENGTGFVGVYSGTPIPVTGDDWDANDDGVLEIPAGVSQHDAITWTDGGAGDALYASTVVGPKPLAQTVWRCDIDSLPSYRYGLIAGDSPSLLPDLTHFVPTGVPDLVLTPGAINSCSVPAVVTSAGGAGGSGGAGGTSSAMVDTSRGGQMTASGGSGGAASSSSSKPKVTAGGGSGGNSALQAGGAGGTGGVVATGDTTGVIVVTGPGTLVGGGGSSWWLSDPFGAAGSGGANDEQAETLGAAGSADQVNSSTVPEVPGGCSLGRDPREARSRGQLFAIMGLLSAWYVQSKGKRSHTNRCRRLHDPG